jgi:hypothetical protein
MSVTTQPVMTCYSRGQYVQDRIAGRMQSRGEPMILRSVSELIGIEPYRNPPDLSADLEVVAGSTTGGQAFIGLAGTTVTGRLVPGDQLTVNGTLLTVMPMPPNVMTDADGIPVVDDNLNPIFGTPVTTFTDTLGRNNAFPVVVVSGTTTPEMPVALPVTRRSMPPTHGYAQMSREKMAMGWVELDSIGVIIAGKGVPAPQPKINDQIIFIDGTGAFTDLRSVMTVGVQSLKGVNFTFQLQAR